MKKRLVWIGVAIALGLFAAGAWAFIQPGFAVAALQDYVLRKTGRTLLVNGGARLEFAPQLSVRLDDVFLSNPEGMDGNFARAASAHLPLQLGDLIRRKLKIRSIALDQPVFSFLVDREGHSSWVSEGKGGPTKPSTGASSKEPLTLLVENGSASFLDERNGQAFSLEDASANIGIGDDGELDVQGTASLNKQFARIEARVKSVKRLGEDGSPLDLTITAPALTVNFTGRLATHDGLNLAGAIDATAPDLRHLAKWLGSDVTGNAGLKNFSLDGALDSKGAVFNLTKANVALDGMVANGDVTLDLSKKIPNVSATLSTDVFSLDPYLPSKKASIVSAGKEDTGWDISPVAFDRLKGVDGSLKLSAFQVKWNDAEIGPAELSGTLKDGKLETAVQDATLYGGKATAKVTLDGTQELPVLQLVLDAQGIKGETFLSEFAGVDWLAGNTGLQATLTASGHNQREMMSTLAGTFSIDVSDGEITGLNIVDMFSTVSRALSDGWGEGPENLTSFDTAQASFQIRDGIAKAADVQISGPAFAVTGGGEIDMLRRALDFKFDPKLVTGGNETTGLPVQVAVKGPWHEPKIYPDVEGIFDDPEAAYDTLRDLGVSEKTFKEIGKTGKKLFKDLFGN
ncbi:MAG TPA: AsmA family protein [Aestuariivirga sp.]|nr:AsmA family protein [Aestuariivirga sp.]